MFRVTRLLEYEFQTQESLEANLTGFHAAVMGTTVFGSGAARVVVRSTTMFPTETSMTLAGPAALPAEVLATLRAALRQPSSVVDDGTLEFVQQWLQQKGLLGE